MRLPHVVIKYGVDTRLVYLIIDEQIFELDAHMAREVGEALFKTGVDVESLPEE